MVITKLFTKCQKVIWLVTVCLITTDCYALQIIEELWLSVSLNQQKKSDTLVFLRADDGSLLIAEQDWQQWRLQRPTIVIYQYNQQNYYQLNQIQGLSYQLNEQELSITIEVPVSLFESVSLNAQPNIDIVKPISSTGIFVNYDLSSAINKQGLSDSTLSIENGIFHPWGVLNTQVLVALPQDNPKKVIRLDSTFTHNQVETFTTFRVGDVVSTDLGHIGSMRLGGIKRVSNFNLQPKKIITPMLSMKGEASLPSTVDVFVNNMRTLSQKVPIGAFEVDNIPVITGKGEVSMVIKDMLGRQQQVSLPYYINPEALQVGVHQYSYDIGWIRQDYGLESENYGRLLANNVHRLGLTEYITGEIQVAVTLDQQNLSCGTVLSVANKAAMQTLMSLSRHEDYGSGQSVSIGLSTQLEKVNIHNNFRWQSEEFAPMTRTIQTVNNQFIEDLFISWPINKSLGTLALAYHHQQAYDQSQFQSLQLNYNANINNWFNVSASLTKVIGDNQKAVALLSFSMPLGQNLSANLHLQPQHGQQSVSLQHNNLSRIGTNYYLQHSWGNSQFTQANVNLQNSWGQYRFNTSYANGDFLLQASAAGGLIVMDKNVFFSRQINNSFAMIKVSDYADVKVYKNNQLVGLTNKRGVVFVPQLLPYQSNKLRIDAGDLPFDVIVPSLEKAVVPAFRSGLLVDFAVKRAYGAMMTLQLEQGELLPAGAIIQNLSTGEQILVGLKGQAYLSNLQTNNKIKVNWFNKQCEFNLMFSPNEDGSIPDLGKQVCYQGQP